MKLCFEDTFGPVKPLSKIKIEERPLITAETGLV